MPGASKTSIVRPGSRNSYRGGSWLGNDAANLLAELFQRFAEGEHRAEAVAVGPDVGGEEEALMAADELDERRPVERHQGAFRRVRVEDYEQKNQSVTPRGERSEHRATRCSLARFAAYREINEGPFVVLLNHERRQFLVVVIDPWFREDRRQGGTTEPHGRHRGGGSLSGRRLVFRRNRNWLVPRSAALRRRDQPPRPDSAGATTTSLAGGSARASNATAGGGAAFDRFFGRGTTAVVIRN